MAKKVRELSPKAKEVLAVLQASETALTLAELKDLVPNLNSSHLTALANRDLVSTEKVTKEVVTVTKREVNSYTAVPAVEADAE